MSNVKVYLRIKPHLSDEEYTPLPMEVSTSGGRKKLYFQYRLQKSGTKIFSFDNIFTEETSQDEVYNEFRNDLITSVVNGVGLVSTSTITASWLMVKQVLESHLLCLAGKTRNPEEYCHDSSRTFSSSKRGKNTRCLT